MGTRTALGDIRAPSGAVVRALAWDGDEKNPDDWRRLLAAARLLRRHGLVPILSKNPTKENSGHLWLFLDAEMDALRAQLACHTLAPMLAQVGEHFPDLSTTNGNRIRLPAGVYPAPDHSDPPFLVGAVPADVRLPIDWFAGNDWMGWMAGTEQSAARILQPVRIPAHLQPKPAPEPARPVHKPAGLTGAQDGERFDFARWSRENPIETLLAVHGLDLDSRGYFRAKWRGERTASVKVYPDGHWHDYGPDERHGVDSFDLFCALNDCWDEVENRPDRGAALRLLGYKPGTGAADEAPSVPLPLDDHPPLPRAGAGPVYGLVQQELPVAEDAQEDAQWEEIE